MVGSRDREATGKRTEKISLYPTCTPTPDACMHMSTPKENVGDSGSQQLRVPASVQGDPVAWTGLVLRESKLISEASPTTFSSQVEKAEPKHKFMATWG